MVAIFVESKSEVVGILGILRIHGHGLAQVLECSLGIVQLQKVGTKQRVVIGRPSLRRIQRLKQLNALLKLLRPRIGKRQVKTQIVVPGIKRLSPFQVLDTLESAASLEVEQA